MSIQVKRAYDKSDPHDGTRILVDRLWPRGLTKEQAGVNQWLKEIAPSSELRQWFNHDPERWEEFKQRYRDELEREQCDTLKRLRTLARRHRITLLYAARDREHNNAVALQELLTRH